jgi:hypothetical protein
VADFPQQRPNARRRRREIITAVIESATIQPTSLITITPLITSLERSISSQIFRLVYVHLKRMAGE